MDIAIVSAGISTHSGLRVPVELAIALTVLGHRLTIYAPEFGKDNHTLASLKQHQVKVVLTPTGNLLTQILKLKKIIQNGNHDVINAYCFLPHLLAARLSGTPLVWTYHGTQLNALSEHYFPNVPLYIKIFDYFINIAIWLHTLAMSFLADNIIAISKTTSQELRALYFKNPLAIISWGAQPITFGAPREKKSAKKITLLSVSRITPYKGFHKIIASFNQLVQSHPYLELIIVGSSPLPKYLAYLKKIAGKKIKIFVDLPDDELARCYQTADIYVTADQYLFFGLPVWEASGFGLPTIAYDYKAASESVQHGQTGYIVKNDSEFRYYVQKLIHNQKLRRELGQNARKIYGGITWKKTAQNYLSVFRKLLYELYKPLVPDNLMSAFNNLNYPNSSLVDLGSDAGTNLLLLNKLLTLADLKSVVAVDNKINPQIKLIQRTFPNLKLVKADILDMQKIQNSSFDVAICAQVIEHIKDQLRAMKEIKRILKPGGTLFLSSVAKRWYGLYWHRNRKGEIVVHPDHVHEFKSLAEFTELLRAAGLTILKARAIPGTLPLFDYALRLLQVLQGKPSSTEHRDIYLTHPRLIRWHRRLSFLPLPGYAIVEAIGQKKMHTRFGRKNLMRRAGNKLAPSLHSNE